ncbi:ISP domain-containing protein [Corynespora cassiicola Philippines]|uniref:ISP domain-containing protein n=1 Tax=Corynespora cassiicola Philippines TaxID=1448308 RepID=A0A2T2NFI5_CORCC|nr:ISP domain-containing protein [Corynespora cassiicola Philippines]
MAPFAETPILSSFPDPKVEVFKEPDLIDGWWTSEQLLRIERRAIFSKTWVCICHRSRFSKPGDYISMDFAGYPILAILGKDNIVRVFHNVCRHRAYTITKKPAGSSLVLGCRYHGWSYDTKGGLVKAPHFEGVEGFDKSENGLFKIRTCTDKAGFVHVNLDTGDIDSVPDCGKLVEFCFENYISTSSKWLTGWELGGGFNWKTVGASDRTGIGTVDTLPMETLMGIISSLLGKPKVNVNNYRMLQLEPCSLIFVFPNSQIWGTLSALPLSADQCNVKCDLFSGVHQALEDSEVEVLKTFFGAEVHALEKGYDALRAAPPKPAPSIYNLIKAHLSLERVLGREIMPGKKEGKSESFCKAEKLCNDLDRIAQAGKFGRSLRVDSIQGGLEW